MIEKVKKTIQRFSMLKRGTRILLCVSGGPDSIAMLYVFAHLKKSMGLKIYIAHLNHMLRGKDSDRDERYVKRLAGHFKFPVMVARKDIRQFSRSNKLSLEDAARRTRYDFFLKAAQAFKADAIATAHTKDDQAETVLMRILRGAGLKGLRGILPISGLPGFSRTSTDTARLAVIRPMINISRKEINEYLKKKKIRPRLDKSNLDPVFFRNKIRLKLIPLLEKEYSRNIKGLLCNLSEVLDKDYEYFDQQIETVFKKIARFSKKDKIRLSLSPLRREHVAVQRGLIRKAIERLVGSLDKIDYKHWKELEELMHKRPSRSLVHLPKGIEAAKTEKAIEFRKKTKTRPQLKKATSVIVKIPGKTPFGRKHIKAVILKRSSLAAKHAFTGRFKRHLRSEEYFDIDKIQMPLTLRFRQPGDKMIPLGMRKYKKVSDILVDGKIPLSRRDNIILVISATGKIVWLCGVRMSDKYKISSSKTKRILKLSISTK